MVGTISVLVFPLLGVVGVAWAILSVAKAWERRALGVAVFVVSVAMCSVFVPLWASQRIGSLLRPAARARAAQVAHRAAERYRGEKGVHYDSLVQRFQIPVRVIDVRPAFLLLEDHSVVELLGFDDFGSWEAESLIGREVTIVLPDRKTFEGRYVPGVMSGFAGPRPKDPGTQSSYGDVPAFVLLEGELLNKRFSRYPELFERFFRDHAALVR